MEWGIFVLALSLGSLYTVHADCAKWCSTCNSMLDNSVKSLTCTLECEGVALTVGEWERCDKALWLYNSDPLGFVDKVLGAPVPDEDEAKAKSVESFAGNQRHGPAKRYGGFMKKVYKTRVNGQKLARENGYGKGQDLKYGGFLQKFGERDASDLERSFQELETATENALAENEEDGPPAVELKRYGGFMKGFGYKRSAELTDEDYPNVELQKRYGGFMRRIGRPRYKWDNQKRYGGFLRRNFRVSVRSDDGKSNDYTEQASDL